MQIIRILQYNDVFTETPLPIKEYLKTIPKNVLIQTLAHFNGYFIHNSKYNKSYTDFLNNYFQEANNDLKNQIFKKIRIIELKNQYKSIPIEIISTLSTLFLIEEALSIENSLFTVSEDNFDKKLYEINLFKAVLLKNQEIDSIQTEGYSKLPVSKKIPALLITTLPDTEFNNRLESQVFMCQIVKAKFLFEFLENELKCSTLMTKLLEEFGVDNMKEIFKHLIHLGSFVLSRDEGQVLIEIPKDDFYNPTCDFFDIFSKIQIGIDYDFTFLRSSPLFKLKEGQYTVIHKNFLFEKIFKGWYFKLNEINNKLEKSQKIPEFKSFFGQHFSEDFLLRKVLVDIFSKKSIFFSGNEIKIKFPKISSEPDYYARDWNKIYLFENKDTLLKANVMTSYNFLEIEKELKEKFFESKKGKEKAVKQLVGNVKRILTNTLEFDTLSNPNKIDIYPILVLHEDCYNAAGLNFLINQWFIEELQVLEKDGFAIKRVRPLTIITIDTLILLKDILVTKKVSFNELLDDYTSKYLKSIKNNVTPFSAFINLKFPNLKVNKEVFVEYALDLAF